MLISSGIIMGMIGAFLGIGGGPINMALLMFGFGYGIKEAGVKSIVVILFSQSSALISL